MSSNTYYLSPDVYFSRVEEGGLLLDLGSLKYLGVPAQNLELIEKLFEKNHISVDAAAPSELSNILEPLASRGILTKVRPPETRISPQYSAANDSIQFATYKKSSGALRPSHLVAFLASYRTAWMIIRLKSLKQYIRKIAKHKLQTLKHHPSPKDDLETVVSIFRYIRPWFYMARDRCLLDALVLTEFLRMQNHKPTLIIGAQVKPFLAHSWVQFNDVVLDDTVENVQLFSPLVAI